MFHVFFFRFIADHLVCLQGWWRLAAAHMEEQDFVGAKHVYEEALRYCPGDPSLIDAMKKNAALKRLDDEQQHATDAVMEKCCDGCKCKARCHADRQ